MIIKTEKLISLDYIVMFLFIIFFILLTEKYKDIYKIREYTNNLPFQFISLLFVFLLLQYSHYSATLAFIIFILHYKKINKELFTTESSNKKQS